MGPKWEQQDSSAYSNLCWSPSGAPLVCMIAIVILRSSIHHLLLAERGAEMPSSGLLKAAWQLPGKFLA